MPSLSAVRVSVCIAASTIWLGLAWPAAADGVVKVAFWNVMSGKGVDALPGFAAPFVNSPNCSDPAQPMNAWGTGASQAVISQVANDPTVVAFGLAEAWTGVCGSGEHVRQLLGWKARTAEQNGVTLVARYGFSGPEQWQQLDTSGNPNPRDTMWVVRAPVCVDPTCTHSLAVYVTHWYTDGDKSGTTYATQAQQTVSFLATTSHGESHVLIGDLNVWEGPSPICNVDPTNGALPYLRAAGYLDAWVSVRGAAEGYTGMINRAGCGIPIGYPWKRIDYAWTPAFLPPLDIRRFGLVPVTGDASPSDHLGIVVSLPDTAVSVPPAPPLPGAIWTSAVNATVSGSLVQKTSGCGSCFDAGAIGTAQIPAGGAIAFSVTAGQRLFAGLGSDTSASTSYQTIDYAFSFWPSGTWEIRERNLYRKEGSFAAADQFSIAVEGTAVKYYKNGALVFVSPTPAALPLVFDVSLASVGASVQNLAVPPPIVPVTGDVTWTSLVKATATGATLQKAGTCGSCFDAGALSQQRISGDGELIFTVAAGQRLFVGLARDTTATISYTTIDYALSFWPNGTFEVRENNTYRAEGALQAGDVFRLSVKAGIVTYYRNLDLIYTSRTPVSGALVVDASLASLSSVVATAALK